MSEVDAYLEALLAGLVACDSVSPTLAGGPGERAAATYVAERLEEAGLRPEVQEAAPGRFNVVAVAPGRGLAPPLLFNAHLDTVGVEGMDDPFTLRRTGDRLYGRGAYDMKGSAAVMLALARHAAHHPAAGDVLLTFVADEEDRSLGTAYLVDRWLPDLPEPPAAAFVLEPTEERIGLAHKGFAWLEMDVEGRAAHGSRPDEGIDAIVPLGAALSALQAISAELEGGRRDALLGTGTLHAARIEGGSAWSVYPAAARLQWERRTLPGETDTALQAELDRVLAAVRAVPGGHAARGRVVFVRPPHAAAPDSLPARLLRQADPSLSPGGVAFWADSALLAPHVPTVLYGPAGHGAHAVDEWVSLASLARVHDTLRRLLDTYGPA